MISKESKTSSADSLNGDRPIEKAAEDLLGFLPMAEALAGTILAQAPTPGLVIGLEGAWGSGKSSLLNLTRQVLRDGAAASPVKVLEFKPWLIGDRDQLLTTLFSDLAKVFDEIEADRGDLTGKSVSGAKQVGETLRRYASRLSGPGKLIEALDVIPGAKLTGIAIQALAELAEDSKGEPSLAALKDKVETALKTLGVPVVVTIDDVDRLDPAEAVEILRLVRSVADLPNVIYILCYDHAVLKQAVARAAHVEDGATHLEKITQVVVETPVPEPYDLRFWFSRELRALIGPLSTEQASRLDIVIDSEGGRRLTTPRAVVRALNSLNVYWPALRGRVDVADLTWLHLIKATNTQLYRWIETYCASYSATERSRASLTEAGRRKDNDDLKALLKAEGRALEDEIFQLANHLPGIQRMVLKKDEDPIFVWSGQHEYERSTAVANRRLSSPDHYRLYFALAQPTGASVPENFRRLSEALNDGPDAVERLLFEWSKESSTLGVTRLEKVLNRLSEGAADLDEAGMERFWGFMADRLDGRLAEALSDHWGRPKIWALSRPLVTRWMKASADHAQPRAAIVTAFKSGKALSWLTDLYHREALAGGRVEGESYGRPSIPASLVQDIEAALLPRLDRLGPRKLLALPDGFGALLAWAQCPGEGREERVRSAIGPLVRTNAGLLKFLESIQGQSMSRGDDGQTRIERYLQRSYVDLFLDADEAEDRLRTIISNKPALRRRAEALQLAFMRGRR